MMRRLIDLGLVMLGLIWAFAALSQTEEPEREGGILGTGIVGTITALGSIYVNGQHILFDHDLTADNLRPGHTVAVLALPEGSRWRASDIRQILPLVGPAQISPDGQLTIMGTPVLTPDGLPPGVTAGDWIAVSGLWQAGQVIATRVDVASNMSEARIEGTVFDISPDKPLILGGTTIAGLQPQHLQEGDVIRAVGAPTENGLQVRQLETGVFATAPGLILVEGYYSTPRPSGLYTVLGSNIVSYTETPEMIDPLARQLICSNAGTTMSLDVARLDETDTFLLPEACRAGIADDVAVPAD